MPAIKHHKVVASLPAQLEANSVYYVRVGTGFDVYVTNSTGLLVAYPMNQPAQSAGLLDGGSFSSPAASAAGILKMDFGGFT